MALNEVGCRSQRKQWLAALITSLPMATVGTLEPLVSIQLNALSRSKDAVLAQLGDWAILFLIIGCITGAISGAVSADMFGRKKALFATIICVVGEIISFFFTGGSIDCITVLIEGITAGIACTVVPLYISEITEDQIRGRLLMLPVVGIFTGQLVLISLQFLTGYALLNISSMIIPILFLITVWWLPETPHHLVSKKQYEAAEKSLIFLRGIDQLTAKEELEVIINDMEKNRSPQGMSQRISELFRGTNRKGLIIVAFLIIAQWSRIILDFKTDVAYALQDLTKISIETAITIIVAMRLIWGGILVCTIDIVGRRLYLLGSTLGGLVIAGLALVINDRPIAFFLENIILHLCEIVLLGICFVFVGELFPTNVKSIASATAVIFGVILKFLILEIDNWVVPDLLDYEFIFLIPIYLLAFVFVLTLIPETKKKSFSAIQNALADNGLKCRPIKS